MTTAPDLPDEAPTIACYTDGYYLVVARSREEARRAAIVAYEIAYGEPAGEVPEDAFARMDDKEIVALGEPLCIERRTTAEWARRLPIGSVWVSP